MAGRKAGWRENVLLATAPVHNPSAWKKSDHKQPGNFQDLQRAVKDQFTVVSKTVSSSLFTVKLFHVTLSLFSLCLLQSHKVLLVLVIFSSVWPLGIIRSNSLVLQKREMRLSVSELLRSHTSYQSWSPYWGLQASSPLILWVASSLWS